MQLQKILLVTLAFLSSISLYATHNRAGEISVEQDPDNPLCVKAVVVTYTQHQFTNIDRDSLEICWGDGHCEMIARDNGPGNQGEILENNVKKNTYTGYHCYNALGSYAISMTDPNRNEGILNINPPFSGQIPFHIETIFTLLNPSFQGFNSTPQLLQPPIDLACVGQVFTHNPNAYDADGDSLSYHFITPLQSVGVEVPLYKFPHLVYPSPDHGNLTINETTGDIVWDWPQQPGEYNLAIIIVEHRGGFPIDTTIRDMQILVQSNCDNLPPEVMTPFEEVCVIAGETLEFDVSATAPIIETSQKVRLTALGGPFEQDINPAEFLPDEAQFLDDPNTKTFRWETTCEHISDQYYSVVFKATDNYFSPNSGLATLKTVRIKVMAPPPENVEAIADNSSTTVSWDNPYSCEETTFEYFRGFSVWRRDNSNNFTPDDCETGLEGRGYTRLSTTLVKDISPIDNRYFYEDTEVETGKTYCYRVLAHFARNTPSGISTYNPVESVPSNEFCIQLKRDIPVLTNVDILSTSPTNGEIEVCWAKPRAEDLDTLINTGPYVYEIWRAPGLNPDDSDFVFTGTSFSADDFYLANDTCFTDINIDTETTAQSYRIDFYANDNLIGTTPSASSVFLSSVPTDNTNQLSWQANVGWFNYTHTIFRKNPGATTFEEIATTSAPNYNDTGLINGKEYCYRVLTTGTYSIDDIKDPLLNNSQELCSIPVDDIAPCPPPNLEVDNICNHDYDCNNTAELINTLTWDNPIDFCEETDDVVGYNIYYAPSINDSYTQIGQIMDSQLQEFEHSPASGLAGCYYVTAIDTFSNESIPSEMVCVDNCPHYELPNTFTPNGDGQNDLFTPYPYCFINKIDIKIFNRWGNLVFETTDPDINWDGTNRQGNKVTPGVYYYTCRVFEERVDGVIANENELKGYIELITGQ